MALRIDNTTARETYDRGLHWAIYWRCNLYSTRSKEIRVRRIAMNEIVLYLSRWHFTCACANAE